MNTVALKKRYDPYQAVDLGENTSSIDSRRAAILGTTKPFSGGIWYSKEQFPPSQLILKEGLALGTTSADLHAPNPSGLFSWVFQKDDESVHSIYTEPVVVPKQCYSEQPRWVSLQKWEGIVLGISEDSLTARLIDLTQNGTDEETEFSLEEIPEADLPLVKLGAVFYWNVGYEDSLSGQRMRVSILRFRRLPVWRTSELEEANREAIQLVEEIGWK